MFIISGTQSMLWLIRQCLVVTGRFGVLITLWLQEVVAETFKPAVGPTHPFVQWAVWFFPGSKRPERDGDHLHIVPR